VSTENGARRATDPFIQFVVRNRNVLAVILSAVVLTIGYVTFLAPHGDAVLHAVGTMCAGIAAACAWLFCAIYSRAGWRAREVGRHLMWSTAVKALVFTYVATASTVIGGVRPTHIEVFRFWTFVACAAILSWRLKLVVQNVYHAYHDPMLVDAWGQQEPSSEEK